MYRLPKGATVLLNEAKSVVDLLVEDVDILRAAVVLRDCAIGDANVIYQPTVVQVRVQLRSRRIVPVTLWLCCISLPLIVGCASVSLRTIGQMRVRRTYPCKVVQYLVLLIHLLPVTWRTGRSTLKGTTAET
jgi:hypothetical protein